MKTIVLFFAALLSIGSVNAQFNQDFEGTESSLTGNCWTLDGVNITNSLTDVITGAGSLYSKAPTSPREMISTALNITNTSFTISFNYKVNNPIPAGVTRTIEVGLLDPAGTFTSLTVITLDENSPVTVQNFNQTFTLPSTGLRKLSIRFDGTGGHGSIRMLLDDISTNTNPRYGAGTCTNAPLAVNDHVVGLIGHVVNGNVVSNDSDPDGENFVPALVTPSPDGLVTMDPDGSFSFTPNPGFLGSVTTFTYRLTDNGFSPAQSNIATVTIALGSPIVTPIKLISFDAKYNKPNVTLNWSTAQEKNFSHFVIEQSVDGIHYSERAVVFGTGESDSRRDYQFIDNNLAGRKGLVYYRLVSVDMDNKASYSSVRIIRLAEDLQLVSITTYPNPVSNELRITVPADWQNKKVVYEIVNGNGQVAKRTQSSNSSQTETINTSDLSAGFYLVRVSCETISIQQKIIKL